LGHATTRTLDRMAAAIGTLNGAPIEFERVDDVPEGGVLLALPALLENGLLRHSRAMFSMKEGFYPLETIFLLLALMALARIGSLEGLRYFVPGEWGKLLGLDRIPEVKTLRDKISSLCHQQELPQRWSSTLAKEWMEADPQSAGVFYIDGHVRVYHGELTDLPRRYIARQRLCLRGTTDYWVNAMDGQPFFVVTQAVDPGLLTVLQEKIIPRLLEDAPLQPTTEEIANDKLLHRFVVVFDREGYSPEAFAGLKEKRIAIISYHKYPKEQWPIQEFSIREVQLIHGEKVQMQLAERGCCLSNGLWVREIRKRSDSGHQTSILSTDYRSDLTQIAPAMFARWCQENFFKYMCQHYNLDRLAEYQTQALPDSTRVVHPAWRHLDSQVRKQLALLNREQARFGAFCLQAQPTPQQLEDFLHQKGEMQQQISQRQCQIDELKKKRKELSKHIEIKDLPEKDRFERLREDKKHFLDTIKLIAYRAETAMVHVLREKMQRLDDARALVRQVFSSTVDLIPDHQNKSLTVRLHHMTAAVHDEPVKYLCEELNATETLFPGTDLRLIFKLSGSS